MENYRMCSVHLDEPYLKAEMILGKLSRTDDSPQGVCFKIGRDRISLPDGSVPISYALGDLWHSEALYFLVPESSFEPGS